MEYPIYNFKVKEDGTKTGMLGISLVNDPAIESSFITFKAQDVVNKTHYVALKDEKGNYKQEVLGAALRPDLPILRKDDAGNFYYGVFDSQTIETIRNKFHKQKNTSEVNLQHDPNQKIDAYLIESYIIQTEEQLAAVKGLGLEDIELNAWVVRYKIESEELFNSIIDGTADVTGFSVEVMLERELVEATKNNFNQKNIIMSKFNDLIDRFKSVLAEFEEDTPETPETTELEDVTVADSGMVLRYTDTGAPVLEVTVDEEGNEETVGAQEGEYILEDGRTLVVDADGNLVEIKEGDEEVEPVEEDMEDTEKTEESKEENLETEESKEEETSQENLEEEEAAEENTEGGNDLSKSLNELIPTDSDGTYSLEVYVSDGKISFGTLYAYTYKDLKFDKLVEEFENLKQENQELKKQPVSKPVFSEFKADSKDKKKKTEFKNNLDFQLHRLGIDNE